MTLPDGRVSSFTTGDADEARAVASKMFYGGAIRPAGRGLGFECRVVGTRVGPVSLGLVGFGTRVTIGFRGVEGSYGVSVPTLGPLEQYVGSHQFTANPDVASVSGPFDALEVDGWESPGDRLAHLRFDRAVLEGELGRMLGVDAVDEIRFPSFWTSGPDGAPSGCASRACCSARWRARAAWPATRCSRRSSRAR
ncbi:hypothetical protein ACRAWC_16330 [Leifsonia sp. L25]|uniref:AraC-like ligand-binding domain-containing protein n=1 Tax=Actinomycetes TaxID=1760 RepID=UPI003D683EB0